MKKEEWKKGIKEGMIKWTRRKNEREEGMNKEEEEWKGGKWKEIKIFKNRNHDGLFTEEPFYQVTTTTYYISTIYANNWISVF